MAKRMNWVMVALSITVGTANHYKSAEISYWVGED